MSDVVIHHDYDLGVWDAMPSENLVGVAHVCLKQVSSLCQLESPSQTLAGVTKATANDGYSNSILS